MLAKTAKKYYDKKYNLNCAETMIYAANEEYNLNLDSNTFKTMGGFGGGMAVEDVCGAVSGSIAVIGIMFIKEKAHENSRVKDLTAEFIKRFDNELGTRNCKLLKDKYRNDDDRCLKMIETAADILDDIIKEKLQ
jgi:C_GCAxxG_C_C family probable redox protein